MEGCIFASLTGSRPYLPGYRRYSCHVLQYNNVILCDCGNVNVGRFGARLGEVMLVEVRFWGFGAGEVPDQSSSVHVDCNE